MAHRLMPLLLGMLVLVCHSVQAENIDPQIPAWVQEISPQQGSMPDQEHAEQGVFYRLTDTQIQIADDNQAHYFFHYSMQILNSHGVEANSQLNFDYDPAYQQLALHRLDIIRDGQRINKLNSAKLQQLKREQQMDQLIYDGALTLNAIIDDVRVGDTIDYAYSIIGMNPVYQGRFGFTQYLSWEIPLQQLHFRLLWQKTQPLYLDFANSDAEQHLQQITQSNGIEFRIKLDDIAAHSIDANTPSWYDPWARLHLSEHPNWQSVARWGQALYQDAYSDAAELDVLTQQWKNEFPELKQQVSAALAFVQNEVRYLGIELGTNSHIPSQDIVTLQRRFGDCKDKTVLFIALLRRLGVDAYPALVNTEYRHKLSEQPASARSFDHVITYAQIAGQDYWLDPTRSNQFGGIDKIYPAAYGQALILQGSTTGLTEIKVDSTENIGLHTHDRYQLPSNNTDSAQLQTTLRYIGLDAESQRNHFAQHSRRQIQQAYLEFIGNFYPSATVAQTLDAEDLPENNQFITHEYYTIPQFWELSEQGLRFDADFYATMVRSPLLLPDLAYRNDPLAISYPNQLSQQIDIQFADDDWLFEAEDFVEDNPFFRFTFSARFDMAQRLLSLTYDYQSHSDHVTAEDFPAYFAALKKVSDYLSYGIYNDQSANIDSDNDWSSNVSGEAIIGLIALLYFALFLFLFGLWRWERRYQPEPEQGEFYPISISKFCGLYFATFGAFGAYWFYKNFQFLKRQQGLTILPFMRGLFCTFFYYPLWRHLYHDSQQRFAQPRLFSSAIAIIFAILFAVLSLTPAGQGLFDWLALLVMAALLLPLVSYILQINQAQPALLDYNSRWRPRNIILIVALLPLILLSFGSDVGILPSDSVISGDKLLSYDRKALIKKQVIRPDEPIVYFYSEDFFSNQRAGNGFTDNQVFSYWTDSEGFNLEQASFKDVADIEVTWADDRLEDTVVSVNRHDGSRFTLFASSEADQDRVFVASLKQRWQLSQQ